MKELMVHDEIWVVVKEYCVNGNFYKLDSGAEDEDRFCDVAFSRHGIVMRQFLFKAFMES